MLEDEVYIQTQKERMRVLSLAPYLSHSLNSESIMDASLMRKEDISDCRWLGFGIGKGVTNPKKNFSVYALSNDARSGLHADLLRDRDDVDPFPLCYDQYLHKRGFGGFIRWVYFADPQGGSGVFGIDWSIVARPKSGVANSMVAVFRVAETVIYHGIPPDAEVALLNARMCEENAVRAMRESAGLYALSDWVKKGNSLFWILGDYCPRCGLKTRKTGAMFCFRCGAQFACFWKNFKRKEGKHGMETRLSVL